MICFFSLLLHLFFFSCRKTWKPPNTCAGCVWRDSSFISSTRVACECCFFARLAQFLCLCPLSSGARVRSHLCPPLSSERSVTPCLLSAPRSPFSLYPFLVFQCSLVPLCLLIRGEQHCQPPPTVQPPNKTPTTNRPFVKGLRSSGTQCRDFLSKHKEFTVVR